MKTINKNHKLLHSAASGDVEAVIFWLTNGADVDCIAIASDFTDISQVCLVGFTPLMVAAGYGFDDIVKLLLDSGACIDGFKKGTGESALSLAALYGNIDCVRLMLESGAAIDQKGNHFSSPLLAVCTNFELERCHLGIAYILLKAGADPNARDKHGFTPLMRMMCHHSFNQGVITALLDHGADPLLQNAGGLTCFDLAMIENRIGRVEFVQSYLENRSIDGVIDAEQTGSTTLDF